MIRNFLMTASFQGLRLMAMLPMLPVPVLFVPWSFPWDQLFLPADAPQVWVLMVLSSDAVRSLRLTICLTICLIHFDESFSILIHLDPSLSHVLCTDVLTPSVPSCLFWRTQHTKHRSMRFARMLTLLASASAKIHHTIEVNTNLERWQSTDLKRLFVGTLFQHILLKPKIQKQSRLASFLFIIRARLGLEFGLTYKLLSSFQIFLINNYRSNKRNNIDQCDSILSLRNCSTRPARNEKRPTTQCILGFWLV